MRVCTPFAICIIFLADRFLIISDRKDVNNV